MSRVKPHLIAVTMGDPNGVGPELVIKAWQRRKSENLPPFFYIADPIIIQEVDRIQNETTPFKVIQKPQDTYNVFDQALPLLSPFKLSEKPQIGVSTTIHAPAVIQSLKIATQYALNKDIDAIVTAPLNKKNVSSSKNFFQGQTEFFAQEIHRLSGQKYDPIMMLASDTFRCVLITTHLPLKDVSAHLSQETIIRTILITIADLQKYFCISSARLAICGLNPHAGEEGLLGDEEKLIINPAINTIRNDMKHAHTQLQMDALYNAPPSLHCLLEKVKMLDFSLSNALPSDSIFHAESRDMYDCFVAMYHDQALIPIKMANFYNAVNITLGLPIIRTSPDHGTAYSIAGHQKASPSSMIAAIKQAGQICMNTKKNNDT